MPHKNEKAAHTDLRRKKIMKIANIIAYVLVLIGALNWGLFGFFNFNLVGIFGGARSVFAVIVYTLIALSAIWLIISPCITDGKLDMNGKN